MKAVSAIGGKGLREAREALRWPHGFCYMCETAEEADALRRQLVAAGALCTVKYVDAFGRPAIDDATRREAAAKFAEKCAKARTLMEQAKALIEEVLKDAAYRPEQLPYGVCPDGVEDYPPDAIGMLIPEREPATA